jgi:RNA 2',3'-cyclic 3'-phosphodiesterase
LRLFIAIEIPREICENLQEFLKELREIAPQVKWARVENLHVTLKFLGNTEVGKLEQLQTALKMIRSPQPVTLQFRGLGFFPNEKKPRVFWAGMDSSANLRSLAQDIDRTMHQFGFPLEDRPFAPHLTLARFDPPGIPPSLATAAKLHDSRGFGSLTAHAFHLIESKLKSTGAEYTTVQSFLFVTET